MIDRALTGDRRYWTWVIALLILMSAGGYCYLMQLREGLSITGLSRDVSWGFYIAQFTFLVGVAASAVMVVLPYYLHDFKSIGRITILGEFMAISAVLMCILFIGVDLGQPGRAFNMFLHPSPRSILFWDSVVLSGYFLLNALIARVSLIAERKGEKPPAWIKPGVRSQSILTMTFGVVLHRCCPTCGPATIVGGEEIEPMVAVC